MEIYRIVEQKLRYFNYADKTSKMYSHYIDKFITSVGKNPKLLNSQDFENYLLNYNFTSTSQQNQIINAIKFFYEKVLERKYNKIDFQRPRKEKKLPQIIEHDYLINQISKIENLKHKAILSLTYSTGLRVSEIINLKIADIDSKRMIINIIQSKGNKDRIVPLSQTILDLLRKYFLKFKPKEYLFNGQFSNQYSSTSCNQIVKKYLGKEYHMHLLRHSCFTTLLNNGVDCRHIQKLAGHSNLKTTEGYLHVSTKVLNKLPLPI